MPHLDYRKVNTGIDGRIVRPDRQGPWPGNMLSCIAVDDLAECRKSIFAAGGTIPVEAQQVPGMGALCLFADPEDRMPGLWKSAPR